MKDLVNKLLYKSTHLKMSWLTVLIFSAAAGVYVGLINQVPFLYDTSFRDIAVSYEWWVLFAMLIIVNQKNFWQAGLKTLVFFLISQTLVFLVEWPFEGVFHFPYWYRWMSMALLTLPFGALMWFTKKDRWYADLLLAAPIGLLLLHVVMFATGVINNPPFHLLSLIFCIAQIIFWFAALHKSPKHIVLTCVFMLLIAAVYLALRRFLDIDLYVVLTEGASAVFSLFFNT